MKKLNIKNFIMSVIALMMTLVLALGVTHSWTEGGNKGYVKSTDEFVITTGSDLTMRQDGKSVSSITIPKCTLEETSSADGRNFFFPMGDNTSKLTSKMSFREGTANDVNKRYISVDFDLEAGANPTDVWLGSGTIVQCDNQNLMNALRVSFNKNDDSEPLVFKPNQMPGIVEEISYTPIVAVSSSGVPTTKKTLTDAFGEYYFSGKTGDESTEIFHLDAQETLHLTFSVWLEGTEFDSNDVKNSNLSIYIEFVTNSNDMVKYTFRDNTHGYSDAGEEYWVKNTDVLNGSTYDTMMYVYDKTEGRYYAMNKTSDTTWVTYIPQTIKDFTFRRYSIDIDQWWNEWNPDMSDIKTDPDGTHTFIAICGNGASSGTELTGCYGYWNDPYDTIRVYIDEKNSTNWGQVVCKVYGKKSDGTFDWTSYNMTWLKNTDDGDLWYCDIKYGSTITGIRFFSTGNEADRFEFFSNETQYYFNGFATWYKDYEHNGKYDADTKKSDTHWIYMDKQGSLIYPSL